MDRQNFDQVYEVRVFPIQNLEVRAAQNEKPKIAGYAAVYNQESEDLGGFREIIEPGFFSEVLSGDVRGLWNHDTNFVLGRTKSGTLRLIDDNQGLGFQIDPPENDLIRDMVLMPMQRGDVDQSSFLFAVKRKDTDGANGDEWIEKDDGTYLRILKPGGCRELLDVSVVTFPAYTQTSAQARSMFETIKNQSAGNPGQEADLPESEVESTALARDDIQRGRLEIEKIKFTNEV